jgi:hypothetical protein
MTFNVSSDNDRIDAADHVERATMPPTARYSSVPR